MTRVIHALVLYRYSIPSPLPDLSLNGRGHFALQIMRISIISDPVALPQDRQEMRVTSFFNPLIYRSAMVRSRDKPNRIPIRWSWIHTQRSISRAVLVPKRLISRRPPKVEKLALHGAQYAVAHSLFSNSATSHSKTLRWCVPQSQWRHSLHRATWPLSHWLRYMTATLRVAQWLIHMARACFTWAARGTLFFLELVAVLRLRWSFSLLCFESFIDSSAAWV